MRVHLEIEMGDETCASEPGKFCEFVRTKAFGTRFWCNMFSQNLLENYKDGWLMRCKQCMEKWPSAEGAE